MQNSTFEYTASHILKMITRGAEVEVADIFCTNLQIQLIAKKLHRNDSMMITKLEIVE